MKASFFTLLVFSLVIFSCKPPKQSTPEPEPPVENPKPEPPKPIEPPEGYDIIGEVDGDLDKDEIPEKVVIFNTPEETDFGSARQTIIFKQKEGQWEEWQVIDGGVLPSEHGGTMGDPFQEVKIERGCIVINHYGGSRHRWAYTHRFRNQNNAWELIGATVNFGAPCESWEDYDYNLSTGKIIYEKETEACDEQGEKKESVKETAEFRHKPESLPGMRGFYPGENEVSIKDTDKIFYY